MKISATTDKRILERELHLKGRVLEGEIAELSQELPDLAERVSDDRDDETGLRESLLAEASGRAERIRRSLEDETKQQAYRTEQSDLEG